MTTCSRPAVDRLSMACVCTRTYRQRQASRRAASLPSLAGGRPRTSGAILIRNCMLGCGDRNAWPQNRARVTARGRPSVRNTWPRNLTRVTARRPRSVTAAPKKAAGVTAGRSRPHACKCRARRAMARTASGTWPRGIQVSPFRGHKTPCLSGISLVWSLATLPHHHRLAGVPISRLTRSRVRPAAPHRAPSS